jgi:hypothetical protein
MLSIEAKGPATIHKVEEVGDSEEEDSVDSVEDRDKSNSQDNTAQPKQLRQTTLIELFHPLQALDAINYR